MFLLVSNRDYLPTLLKLLSRAKQSVDVIEYSFAIGSTNGNLAPETPPYQIAEKLISLKKKHGSKIKIRVYLEGHRETVDRNRVTGRFLKTNNVQVIYGSTHAKGFCIDNRFVLFGSTNLTTQSISKNNETNLLFDEPLAVQGFVEYFEHLWSKGKHNGVKVTRPMLADGEFKNELISVIDQAKKRIDFSIYFFHHAEIEKALGRAHLRGVKITGFIHDHASFALSYVRRSHATVSRLKSIGLTQLYYGPNHLFTHSKFLVADQEEIMLGTGNWLVEDVKIHPQLYLHIQSRELGREMVKMLRSQIKDQGRPA